MIKKKTVLDCLRNKHEFEDHHNKPGAAYSQTGLWVCRNCGETAPHYFYASKSGRFKASEPNPQFIVHSDSFTELAHLVQEEEQNKRTIQKAWQKAKGRAVQVPRRP